MAPKGRGGKGGRGGRGRSGKGKQGATGSASNTAPSREYPRDVIFAILSRLPVKSVLRFKCASKQWRTISNLPAFTAAHLLRTPAGLLIHAPADLIPGADQEPQPDPPAGGEPHPDYPNGYAIFTYTPTATTALASWTSPVATVERFHFPGYDGLGQLDVVGTTPNGLVCIVERHFAQSFTIWNPATRATHRIPVPRVPRPNDLQGVSAGFAFDPASSNDYTVIRIVRFINEAVPDVAQLYSFQTGRWERLVNDIAGGLLFRPTMEVCEVVVDGVPYWRAMESEEGMGVVEKLVWYDPRETGDFHSAMFRWRIWSDTVMCLSEITPGSLGAMVWDRPEGVWEDRALDVWTFEPMFAAWVKTYRVELGTLPVVGRVVGFYGEGELVQEIVGGTDEEPKLCLCITKFDYDVKVKDVCIIDGAWPGACKVASYKPSLTRLPRVGCSLI